MKKVLPLLLALCLLTGCTNSRIGIPDAADASETSAQLVLPVPDEATVRNRFEKALEVYGWFDLCSLEVDTSRSYVVDGKTYYRVVSEEVPDFQILRTIVYDLFSAEIGDALFRGDGENIPYRDINGELYSLDGARGADITKGDYTLTVETENSTSILCKVQVEIIDLDTGAEEYRRVVGTEEYTYAYRAVGNRWVFTDFHLFY